MKYIVYYAGERMRFSMLGAKFHAAPAAELPPTEFADQASASRHCVEQFGEPGMKQVRIVPLKLTNSVSASQAAAQGNLL